MTTVNRMSLLRYFEGAKLGKRLKINKIVSEDEKKMQKKITKSTKGNINSKYNRKINGHGLGCI